ncbi:hypothetical protein [uncultured Mucilaginibacter sp.]|nr:hypothetical protein [uncultured Mucilaginibacter sp.]
MRDAPVIANNGNRFGFGLKSLYGSVCVFLSDAGKGQQDDCLVLK